MSLFRSTLLWLCSLSLIGFTGAALVPLRAQDEKPKQAQLPAVFDKPSPESIDDLKAIQQHLEKIVKKVMPSVVCVRIGNSSGSGVIVTKDGYVLTAGHVTGAAGRDVAVIFHDGKTFKGKTLGAHMMPGGVDSGMIKITTEGDWPHLEMAKSADLRTGQWCFVCSRPGGFKTGRTPPIRLGRLSQVGSKTLASDCILVGGDSGGPLFDMEGRVIGINSRIGPQVTNNMHVPVDQFRDSWDRLAKGEVWGGGAAPSGPWLGVELDTKAQACLVKGIVPNSPAEKAGIKAMDVILKYDGKEVKAPSALPVFVRQTKAGKEVALEVQRGEEVLTLIVTIGKR